MEEFEYQGNTVIPQFTTYQNNGRLALMLVDTEYGEMYSVVTVNIPDEDILNERCSYIDTNNGGDYAFEWLERHGFGKWTGRFGFSGYCTYPEFEFTQEVIDEFKWEEHDLLEELEEVECN